MKRAVDSKTFRHPNLSQNFPTGVNERSNKVPFWSTNRMRIFPAIGGKPRLSLDFLKATCQIPVVIEVPKLAQNGRSKHRIPCVPFLYFAFDPTAPSVGAMNNRKHKRFPFELRPLVHSYLIVGSKSQRTFRREGEEKYVAGDRNATASLLPRAFYARRLLFYTGMFSRQQPDR